MSQVNYGMAVDIGNTRATVGLFTLASGRVTSVGSLSGTPFQAKEIAAYLKKSFGDKKVTCASIGSVVPAATKVWQKVLNDFVDDVLVVNSEVDIGIPVRYPKPETIGADRLANAAGASIKYGRPVIVADFGTALTYDIITKQDGYVGGIIEPGLSLMFEYLAERTALLPEISRTRRVPRIGTSTEKAMQLGAHLGYRGMVRETLTYLLQEFGDSKITLVATGGDHEWVVKGFDPVVISDHTLTLFGLGAIYRMNRNLL